MKTLFRLFAISFLAGIMVSCLDETDNTGFTPATPEISFEEETINIDQQGGERTVRLNSNLPWRVSSDSPWVSVVNSSGLEGGDIVVNIQRNRTRDIRNAVLTAYVTEDYKARLNIIQDATPAGESFVYYVKTDGNAAASGLTWEEATTLPTAMEMVGDGDKICLAAGTYTPVALLQGGETEEEKTFEIHSNFTLEGGYPADAVTGAVCDHIMNPTILSGILGSVSAYHVVTVTAVQNGSASAVLKNLVIRGGVGRSAVEEIRRSVGNSLIDAGKGAGLFIGKSNTEIINCTIEDNKACHAAGVSVFIGAVAKFENCIIRGNSASNNGGGIWNEGATVYMNNCTIDRNMSGQQAAGYYSIDSGGAPSISRIYNTTISNNDNTQKNAKRSGGGAYIRAGSDAVFVNCTFTGNKAGYGGVVSGHGTSSNKSKTTFISCTMTGNSATAEGGCLFVYNNDADIFAYNSIVSGNTAPSGADTGALSSAADISHVKTWSSIVGSTLLNSEGAMVSGWSFSSSAMLGTFGYQGTSTTMTFPLVNSSDNPAVAQGMSQAELAAVASSYSPAVDSSVLSKDQNGLTRIENSIGSCTIE